MNGVKLERMELKGLYSCENIRKYRDEKCYSQEYVARQLDIQQSTYQRIETGKVKISTNRLSQLARIFNKPIEAFFGTGIKISTDDFDNEINLMREIITQKDDSIRILEEKIFRRDNKIKELKRQIEEKAK
ncbi:helix-turn-helix transcriptional regulator [Pedobacter riviphilus]|uniref:Helix-turn-helix transcriptional regulator n=1 Tax=Pedobacter riviphilus TaxID=2766984 RepID=A0ABX6TFK4_9SPHI|nr:helix-turn-helix transcriptional regulator [Pedobacter riviphilus]QNR83710.1 helix-turn-helix transcriptional regulator [Pedobacter riviphilus]